MIAKGTELITGGWRKRIETSGNEGESRISILLCLTEKLPHLKPEEFRCMTQGGSCEKDSIDVPIAREIIANAIQKWLELAFSENGYEKGEMPDRRTQPPSAKTNSRRRIMHRLRLSDDLPAIPGCQPCSSSFTYSINVEA